MRQVTAAMRAGRSVAFPQHGFPQQMELGRSGASRQTIAAPRHSDRIRQRARDAARLLYDL